ncbi:putative integral membrane family protein [Diaporthe ampelina]|uniref:Putative integral membrane family protein n=1 Tax=Diaporthe ampelina TaxID=1214573 RepID=A0A0G2I6J0_9PEZI|nr:putative integral membrane family protein [Diaporthe ampelina]
MIEGTCLGEAAYQAGPWFYQAVSIIADVGLISIPIMMFRTLKIPTRTKIGVILLCCLGVFTCACAIVKTALLPALFDHEEDDKTWSLADLCLWAALEINVGMMCGSMPCMKPLYARLRYGKSVGQSASTGSYQLSDRFASKAGNAIYRHHDIEHTSGPAEMPRAESEDSILPRAVTYGQVETRVQGPSSPRGPPGQAW